MPKTETKAIAPADPHEILLLAQAGDKDANEEVARRLHDGDAYATTILDLTNQARVQWANLAAGKDFTAARDAIMRQTDRLQHELAGLNPTPLERLLTERIALCWLHVQALEMRSGATMPKQAWGDIYEKRLDRANRRFLDAVKALALVRRLALPAVQVNIAAAGGQQVNLSGAQIGAE